ncbi:MAG: BlaI/MecI/CopY family transcriptional regulator [Pseudomonadales bacterium]|nr:BlaI/MecI/CopY family transcriptional regulator [Pseudomonadales bacterium]
MPATAKSLLTDTELELMLILWRLKEASVRQVLDALPSSRQMAYTSASTIIRILEKKGFVGSRKQGKGHIYFPLLDKDEYESRTLGHVVGRLFDNTPASLVARLVSDNRLSEAEITEIRKILDKGEK